MANNITKQGVFNTSLLAETFGVNLYDENFYTEPDGSTWVRIVHHNNPSVTSNLFGSTSSNFEKPYYVNNNAWFNVALCNKITNNNYEFMIKLAATSSDTEMKFRWIQTINPMIATYSNVSAANITKNTSTGYTNFSWGGLYHHGANTYLCANNGTEGNWWGAVGAWSQHQSGIPAWYGVIVTTGYQDLYLRVDNQNAINFTIGNDFLIASNIYEI